MNAHASITITPVRVADLLAEGERMPVYVHVIDHPDARVLAKFCRRTQSRDSCSHCVPTPPTSFSAQEPRNGSSGDFVDGPGRDRTCDLGPARLTGPISQRDSESRASSAWHDAALRARLSQIWAEITLGCS